MLRFKFHYEKKITVDYEILNGCNAALAFCLIYFFNKAMKVFKTHVFGLVEVL